MIQSIRDGISSPWIKTLLFIVAGSMVSFGLFSSSQMTKEVVAKVNGHEISQREVQQNLQNQLNYQKSLGLDVSKMPKFLIDQMQGQVIDSLIQQKLISAEAKDLGMGKAPLAVKDLIKTQFTQSGESFDFKTYKKYLEYRLGKSPAQFEKEVGEELMNNSFVQTLRDTATLPKHLLRANYDLSQTKIKVKYIKLTANNTRKALNVTPILADQLQKFYNDNKENYRTPEKRDFTLSWLNLEKYIPEATEADLKKTLSSGFNAEEKKQLKNIRYRARHILIKGDNLSRAQNIRDKIISGRSFTALARTESEDPGSKLKGGDLGYFSPGSMVAEFDTALKNLNINEVSQPIKSSFGYHIIQLLDKIGAGSITSSRLKNELMYRWNRKALEKENIKNKVVEIAQKDLATQGTTKNYSNIMVDSALTDLPNSADTSIIIGKAMKTALGKKSVAFMASSNNYLYQVKSEKIVPSAVPSFNDVNIKVKKEVEDLAYQKAFNEFIDIQKQKSNDKQSQLSSLANTFNLKVVNSDWFSAKNEPNSEKNLDLKNEDLKPALSLTKGESFMYSSPLGDEHYIVEVTDRKTPDWDKFENNQNNEQNNKELITKKINQWMSNLKDKADIEKLGESSQEKS